MENNWHAAKARATGALSRQEGDRVRSANDRRHRSLATAARAGPHGVWRDPIASPDWLEENDVYDARQYVKAGDAYHQDSGAREDAAAAFLEASPPLASASRRAPGTSPATKSIYPICFCSPAPRPVTPSANPPRSIWS